MYHQNLEQQETTIIQKDKEEFGQQQRQRNQWQQGQQSDSDDDVSDSSDDSQSGSWGVRKNQPSQIRYIVNQRQDELREEREDRFQRCKLERQVFEDEKKYCEKRIGRRISPPNF